MYDLNKKFIFTHPHKCGGTSMEDVLGFLDLRKQQPTAQVFKHASLKAHVDELFKKGICINDFFKFSILRNPWDRVVSFYNHCKYKEYDSYMRNAKLGEQMPPYIKDARNMSFKEFTSKYCKTHFNSDKKTKPFMFLNGKFFLDCVIRLEHLEEDFIKIQDKLQIELASKLPHKNNSEQFLERNPYSEYYDEETKALIEKAFEWDIKTFGYTFK